MLNKIIEAVFTSNVGRFVHVHDNGLVEKQSKCNAGPRLANDFAFALGVPSFCPKGTKFFFPAIDSLELLGHL